MNGKKNKKWELQKERHEANWPYTEMGPVEMKRSKYEEKNQKVKGRGR